MSADIVLRGKIRSERRHLGRAAGQGRTALGGAGGVFGFHREFRLEEEGTEMRLDTEWRWGWGRCLWLSFGEFELEDEVDW